MDTYRDSPISREIHFEGILLDSCPQISCLPSIHVILFAWIPQFLGSLYTGEVCTSNQSEGVHKTKVSNHLFGEKKISQEGYPRLSASECLASLGLMLRFAETIVERHPQRGAITDQVLSLKLAVQHAYTVIKVKYGHASAQDLRNIWRIHLDAYKKAYPDSEPKPKHHYAGHLPDQYTLDGLLLDAFVLERKHHSSKAYGGHMTNPRTYGGAMLTHALLTQINELNEKPTALGNQRRWHRFLLRMGAQQRHRRVHRSRDIISGRTALSGAVALHLDMRSATAVQLCGVGLAAGRKKKYLYTHRVKRVSVVGASWGRLGGVLGPSWGVLG